jgi:hypothetical protein
LKGRNKVLARLIALFQEKVENKYYGKYRAVVTDNQDPHNLGRLKVKVPSLMGEHDIGWAMPCFPYGGGKNRGVYMIPEQDDGVWVEFEAGNISYPIWSGTWWVKGETPEGIESAKPAPDLKIIKSKCGHIIQLDDTPGSEMITIKEAKNGNAIVMDQKGIKITDGANSGNEITLDAQGITCKDKNGNGVSLNATSGYPAGKGIELNGNTRICLEGLIDWLLSHKHIGNMGAPTPLSPDDMSMLMAKRSMPQGGILSDTVKVK